MLSDGPGGGITADALVGRAADLARIHRFLGEAVGGGAALLLSGEAGVGKSVLLDAAEDAACAAGTRVLRAGGVQFEADVSYSGLNQLLFPLHEAFGELGEIHRDALRVALGFGSGPAPDRLVVSNAVLMLLRHVAASRPLLLIVDDLPWIDRVSADVLGFVARRLRGSGVGFLSASRSDAGSYFERSDLPDHELSPIDDISAEQLVRTTFPTLTDRVRQRLVAAARGNPLALMELPAALSDPQRSGLEELPAVLPLGQRLQALFTTRITDLPDISRRLLLLAALDGTGNLGALQAAARLTDGQADLEELAPAERDQLVRIDETTHRLVFRHPLIRSAVVESATSSEARWAHRTLAEVLADQPQRHAWHLGEAAVEPDERVAAQLEDAARLTLRRGDAVGAVRSLIRAADLSELGPDRARRLAEAAYIGAEAAGELSSVSALLEDARRADPNLGRSLHSAAAAVHLLINGDGDIDTAHRLLVGTIEAAAERDGAQDEALADGLHMLLLLCWFGGRAELWDPFYAALDRMGPDVPPLLSLVARTLGDPARNGAAALREVGGVLAGVRDETNPTHIVRAGTGVVYLDRLGDMREASWRVVRQGRDGGPARRHLGALLHLCLDDYVRGRWDEAAELAEEGARLCGDAGYRFFGWYFQYIQALLAAARGEQEAADSLADRITRWATPRRVGSAAVFAAHARTVACIGRADFEAAYRHATEISPAGVLASHVPHALWVTMDLVEAAVRTDRHDEAAAHVRAMLEAGVPALSSRMELLFHGSAALCATDDDADGAFRRALAVPGAHQWPFDLARIQLAHGERLRRDRATTESRVPLGAALEAFERLGARPWAERATKELRATGYVIPAADTPAEQLLTPQEREIALLAASGLTNKQIAEKLFISHRTVGAHLYQIYPKLGITSRASLRDALNALE